MVEFFFFHFAAIQGGSIMLVTAEHIQFQFDKVKSHAWQNNHLMIYNGLLDLRISHVNYIQFTTIVSIP